MGLTATRPRPRLVALGAIGLAALCVALLWLATADPGARLDRGLVAMERLEGFRFELIASVEAGGRSPVGGPLRNEVRMIGEYAAPDRLHVHVQAEALERELVIVGDRQWIDEGDGYHQTIATPVGPLRGARAPLEFLRGGGAASFAGLGFARGALTYRLRLDLSAGDLAARLFEGSPVPPDARGTIHVELGLFDDLVRRQTVEITSGAEELGSGIESVRTTYVVEYWALGEPQEIAEPPD